MRSISLLLFITISCLSFGQEKTTTDKDILLSFYNTPVNQTECKTKSAWQIYNPLQLLLIIYKKTLSEQLSSTCEFEPSCSSFSKKALQELGLIKGVFLTADRLTRCNGNSILETFPYLIDKSYAKIKDSPVQYKFH